jgi:hypothetical protein
MDTRARILVEEEKLTMSEGCYYNPNFFLADALALYLLD